MPKTPSEILSAIAAKLGLDRVGSAGGDLDVTSPIDGKTLARLPSSSTDAVAAAVERVETAFRAWRRVPAPQRGALVRVFGEVLRERKQELGTLVSLETGKILTEGLGEV